MIKNEGGLLWYDIFVVFYQDRLPGFHIPEDVIFLSVAFYTRLLILGGFVKGRFKWVRCDVCEVFSLTTLARDGMVVKIFLGRQNMICHTRTMIGGLLYPDQIPYNLVCLSLFLLAVNHLISLNGTINILPWYIKFSPAFGHMPR